MRELISEDLPVFFGIAQLLTQGNILSVSFAKPFEIEGGIVDIGLSIVGIVAEEGLSC